MYYALLCFIIFQFFIPGFTYNGYIPHPRNMNICLQNRLPQVVHQALLELPGEQARNRIKSQLLALDGYFRK